MGSPVMTRPAHWQVVVLVVGAVILLVGGGAVVWNHFRVDRADGLAVKYGAASSKEAATVGDRCVGVNAG